MSTYKNRRRSLNPLFAVIVVGFVFAGCVNKNEPNQQEANEILSDSPPSTTMPKGSAAEFFESPFLDEQTKKPIFQLDSVESLENFAGKTLRLQRKPIANRYDESVTDEQLFIESEKYSSYFYHVTTTDKYNLEYVQIHDDRQPLKYRVEFGMSRNDIESIFGQPDGINNHPESYEVFYLASDQGQVNFSFEDEKLTSIFIWNTAE